MNIWHVTTEAREDGTGTRSLGYFTGSVKDIAIYCKPFKAYNLTFECIGVNEINNTISIPEDDIIINSKFNDTFNRLCTNLEENGVIFETSDANYLNKSIKILGDETLNLSTGLDDVLRAYEKLDDKEKQNLKSLLK